MKISEKLIKAFYSALINQRSFKHRDYVFKFVKKDVQVKLYKGKKLLSYWEIENNKIESNFDEADAYEKRFIKVFEQLPLEAEMYFQNVKRMKKENSIPRKVEVLRDLDYHFSLLKDNQVTLQNIHRVIEKVSTPWLYRWFDTGGNPDCFADNILMNKAQTKTWIDILLNEVEDERVKKALNHNDSDLTKVESENIYIYPKYAQREGNLVMITEIDHKRFSNLCEKAIEFAVNRVKEDHESFRNMKEIQINWWEKERDFYIAEMIDKQKPRNLRELILSEMKTVLDRRPKPSRVVLEVCYKKGDKKINRISTQFGKLFWI